MIDLKTEGIMLLTQAARVVNPARPAHVSTLWRWASAGIRGIRLETVLIGGRRHTSREAIARFLAALNAPGAVPEPVSAAAEAAGRRLTALGA